jgi:hypothetical protein
VVGEKGHDENIYEKDAGRKGEGPNERKVRFDFLKGLGHRPLPNIFQSNFSADGDAQVGTPLRQGEVGPGRGPKAFPDALKLSGGAGWDNH